MKFELGQLLVTPAAVQALHEENLSVWTLIERHQKGDWGNLSHQDAATNDGSLRKGSDCFECRIFSAYILPKTKVKIWVITEAVGPDGKRASTCVLLPQDY